MRPKYFAGRGRKIIPVLLGFVVLVFFAATQDQNFDSRSLTGPRDGYMIF